MQSVPNTGENMKYARKITRCASAHSYALRNQLRRDTSGINKERDSYLDPEDAAALVGCPNPADMVLIIASRALNRLSGERTGSRRNIHPASIRDRFGTGYDADPNAEIAGAEGHIGSVDIAAPREKADRSPSLDRIKISNCEDDCSECEEPAVPLDPIIMMQIHTHISEMGTVQGACERISGAYIPLPYTLLIHRTVWLFLLTSSFALVEECQYFTPFVTAIIAYVFFGLHEVGLQLEDPFTMSPYALSLSAMCRTNDISVAMALGEDAPPPLKPNGVVLM
mgnify:CR=1 FL=1